jgi:hypothetical protein
MALRAVADVSVLVSESSHEEQTTELKGELLRTSSVQARKGP